VKGLYEIGFVFRGFILVSHMFRKLPIIKHTGPDNDLRGAFISAINSFAGNLFKNTYLEYLESGNILFIFKANQIHPKDSNIPETLILYGLADSQKKTEKYVKKFFEKTNPILNLFISRYNHRDFTELNQFLDFEEYIKEFFESKK